MCVRVCVRVCVSGRKTFYSFVFVIVGVSLRKEPFPSTGGISIATMKELLKKEVELQMDYLKNDDFFRNVCIRVCINSQSVSSRFNYTFTVLQGNAILFVAVKPYLINQYPTSYSVSCYFLS